MLRLLSERGLEDWTALHDSPLFGELVAEGKLVATEAVEDAAAPDGLPGRVAAVLEHEAVPFVSYPYEWTFSMLRNAALLQLELLRRALAVDLTLKDSTPYNVQFRGAGPVFIDVGSFERLRPGEPWAGYRQFCMLFLNPLLLQAYRGIPFQPWLRGSIEGISPEECRGLLGFRNRFRRGVTTHVVLHSRLERRHADTDRDLKKELGQAGFKKELILANVRRLERLVGRLEWKPERSEWSGYGATTTYTERDAERKEAFVADVAGGLQPGLVWDLGCNEGRHARLAAGHARYVVALDADAVVVDRLYRSLRDEETANILPLTMNVADPSPGLGWRGAERRPLAARGRPDLTLCLALVHHVVISGNVPVADLLDWLRSLGGELVIEFPTRDDPMVQRLLVRKRPHDHPDYEKEWFERSLSERFDVLRSDELSTGTRILYHARPRS